MHDVDYPTVFYNVLTKCGAVTAAASLKVFENVRDFERGGTSIVIAPGPSKVTDGVTWCRLDQQITLACSAMSIANLRAATHAVEVAVNYFNTYKYTLPLNIAATASVSSTRYAVTSGSVLEGYKAGTEVPVGTSVLPFVKGGEGSDASISVATVGGLKCWKLLKSGSPAGIVIYRYFGADHTSGVVSCKVYVPTPANSAHQGPTLVLCDTPAHATLSVTFEVNLWYQNAGGFVDSGVAITAATWHDLEITFDCGTHLWTLKWDASTIVAGTTFANDDDHVAILYCQHFGNSLAFEGEYTQFAYSFAEVPERAFCKYTIPVDMATLASASLSLSAAAGQAGIAATLYGIDDTMPVFTDPEDLWTSAITTANVAKTELATGANAFDVLAIMQEIATAWATSAMIGFVLDPTDYSATEYTLTAGNLTISYTFANQPHYIRPDSPSLVEKAADARWCQLVPYTMIYYYLAKETS